MHFLHTVNGTWISTCSSVRLSIFFPDMIDCNARQFIHSQNIVYNGWNHLMQQVGSQLPFPATKHYPNQHPIMTLYSAAEIARVVWMQLRKCIQLNRYIRKYRFIVENRIEVEYSCKHPRVLLPPVEDICVSLVYRRKQFELIL